MSLPKQQFTQHYIEDKIYLDKKSVNTSITQNGSYQTQSTHIQKWENEKDTDSYIANISNKDINFKGILNGYFQREGYGISICPKTKEIYFGYYEDDQRNKQGIYYWPRANSTSPDEMYYGFWRDNKKDNRGIYIWLHNKTNNFEEANFDAFIGEFELDSYKRGTFISKKDGKYFLYHGNFDENGNKNDNRAYFYSSENDRLIRGKIVNSMFMNGYIAFFNSDSGHIENLVYCEFELDSSIKTMVKMEDIAENKKKFVSNELNNFRSVILKDDIFGNVFKRYHEIMNFINTNMHNIEVFNDKNKYPQIIKLCSNYKELYLFQDIEQVINI